MSAVQQTVPNDFTIKEFAQVLRIHPMTVHRMIKSGGVEIYRVGRAVRIPYTELERIQIHGVDL